MPVLYWCCGCQNGHESQIERPAPFRGPGGRAAAHAATVASALLLHWQPEPGNGEAAEKWPL